MLGHCSHLCDFMRWALTGVNLPFTKKKFSLLLIDQLRTDTAISPSIREVLGFN